MQAKKRTKHAGTTEAQRLLTVPRIIRAARGETPQGTFASELGIDQGLLSKYEAGRVNPPRKVIEGCLHILHDRVISKAPATDELANYVGRSLSGEEQALSRVMLACLIELLRQHSYK